MVLCGCVGTIGDGRESASGERGPGAPAAAATGPCRVAFPLRRLTQRQYNNAIADLFKGQVPASPQFPPGELGASRSGFSTEADANVVTLLGAEKVLNAAEEVAVAVAGKLPALLPCAALATPGEACATTFIDDVGRRAFRRPLAPDERNGLLAVFRKAGGADTFTDGIALVVDTILQAAPFLYVVETGRPVPGTAGVVELSDFEIAARLAFLLWDSLPDSILLDAAARGALHSGKEIRSQAERMLADARARATIARFAREWTQLHAWKAGEKTAPEFNAAVADGMQKEFDLFVQTAFLGSGGTLASLLTSPTTFANTAMAAFYGVPAPAGATVADFRSMTLDGSSRAGLLTLPAFLSSAAHSDSPSYVKRGVFVLQNLLCRELPTPPPDAVQRQPELAANASQRQKSAAIRAVAECGTCHSFIDQIGLGFDRYDEIGRLRASLPAGQGGGPASGSGDVQVGVPELDGAFDGPVELAGKLARSGQTESCLARQWLRFAVSRLDGKDDSCAVSNLVGALSGSGQNLREMVLALTGADEFRFRRLGGTP
jgi:Protein of unknown function (DUF1592)/Protein of unknown function (DUF1588)/Protein of unknown function (DUF1595)/Protein of unknown function (DUF1587)/Protein of unknown function (DUF1585)